MIAIEHLQVLTKQVTKQISYAEQLLELLASENEVLITNDPQSLDKVVEEKQTLLTQLESGMVTITKSLSKHGFTADIDGFNTLLQQLPNNSPLHRQWHKLQALALQCKNSNEVNGGIVSQRQHHIRQAMDILKGKPSSKNTYDKQGTLDTRSDNNRVTKA
jgi:flagellar biosynthesis/type III secretory pathway chaperone